MGTTSLLFVIKIPFLIVSRPCSLVPFLLPFVLGWDLDSPVPAQGWGGSAGAVPVPALGLGPSVTKSRSHPAPQPCPGTCSTLWAEPPLAKKPRTALGWSAGGQDAATCSPAAQMSSAPHCTGALKTFPARLSFLPHQWERDQWWIYLFSPQNTKMGSTTSPRDAQPDQGPGGLAPSSVPGLLLALRVLVKQRSSLRDLHTFLFSFFFFLPKFPLVGGAP